MYNMYGIDNDVILYIYILCIRITLQLFNVYLIKKNFLFLKFFIAMPF